MGPSLRHVLDLSDADWVRLERITSRFEEAWARGERPLVDDYLPAAGNEDTRPLLIELVHAELEFRLGHGEPARVEEFLERYPVLGGDAAALCELVTAEIELRRLRDPNLGREEFVDRFPALERELTGLWEKPAGRDEPQLPLAVAAPRRSAGPSASRSPQRLGKFELLEILGRGAFGIVYRAWDSERQTVLALKIPRSSLLATREEADRFLREARSVSALDHPLIVGAYEAGQIDDTYYLATELIQGSTLADQLSARILGIHQGAELIAQVAEALQVAHARGIIHRDLKPSNILIDQSGRPHITDFGLAKHEPGTGSGTIESSLTLEGQLLGTPAYMSPELARGEARRVDARSDVYSLGVILYQILTGEMPFRGSSRMILHQVLQDEPRTPRSLNDRIPRDLETICLKAMAKEPAQRYATAALLAEDLRRSLCGEPIVARPVKAWQRWARRAKAHPGITAMAGLVVLVTALGFAGVLWQWRRAEAARRAEAELARSETRARQQLEVNLYAHLIALAERELATNNVGRAEELLNDCAPALRGWEWAYLKRLRVGAHREIRDPTGLIFTTAFSPDGRFLASGGGDATVKVWDTETGDRLRTLKGHTDSIHGVAYSPDGRFLASAAGGGSVKLWNAETGAEVRTLHGHAGIVYSVAFSPDGRTVATAGGDATVKLWDLRSGHPAPSLTGHTDAVYFVAFSPDGRTVASAGGDATVRLWEAATGRALAVLRGHPDVVFCVAFSPDGRTVASAGGGGIVKHWDVASGCELQTLRGHSGVVFRVAFSPDGRRIASAGADRTTKLWDVVTGQEILTLPRHSDVIWSVAFSADGKKLATAAADGWLKIHDARPLDEETNQHWQLLQGHANVVRAIAYSPDGSRLASADGGGVIRIWDPANGAVENVLHGHAGVIFSIAYSPDGKTLASAGGDGTLKLWNVATGREDQGLRIKSPYSIAGVAFSPDGATLASAGGDGKVRLRDISRGRTFARLRANPLFTVTSIAFSPDGNFLASAGGDGVVKLWDLATDEELHTFGGEVRYLKRVVFSPDGRLLAAAGGDPVVRVWNTLTGEEVHTLRGRSDSSLYDIAFSPDGRTLVSADGGGILRLWDLAGDREIASFSGHTGIIYGVAFSPNGRHLASCSWEKTIKIWDLEAFTNPSPAKP